MDNFEPIRPQPTVQKPNMVLIIGIIVVVVLIVLGLTAYTIYQTIINNTINDNEIGITNETKSTNELQTVQSQAKDQEIYNAGYNLKTALETYYAINGFYPPDNHVEYLWSGNRVVVDGSPKLPAECGEPNFPGPDCGIIYASTNGNKSYQISINYLVREPEIINGGSVQNNVATADDDKTADKTKTKENVSKQSIKATPSVNPTIFKNLVGEPGKAMELSQTITNNDVINIVVFLTPENLIVTGSGANAIPEITTADTSNSLKNWFYFPVKEVLIKPGQSEQMKFTIQVPADASPGSYQGALTYTATTESEKDNEFATEAKISSYLFLEV